MTHSSIVLTAREIPRV